MIFRIDASLFVRLVSQLQRYNNAHSYYSVLFGNFVVGMKRVLDEQIVSKGYVHTFNF